MVPISETIFPFTSEDTKFSLKALKATRKPGSFNNCSSSTRTIFYKTMAFPTRSCSDTVLINSLPMRTLDGRLFVNIAWYASDAFSSDAAASSGVLIKLFGLAVSKAYPTFQQYSYTAITHHMMINRDKVSTTRLAALGAIDTLLSDRVIIVCGLDHGASSFCASGHIVQQHDRYYKKAGTHTALCNTKEESASVTANHNKSARWPSNCHTITKRRVCPKTWFSRSIHWFHVHVSVAGR